MSDVSYFSCGVPAKCPKGGEHDMDGPGIEIVSPCSKCEGTGEREDEPDVVDLMKGNTSRECPACKGEGQYVSGESTTCSKCGASAIDVSIWNGP